MASDNGRNDPRATAPLRMLAEQALSRTAGAPLVPGNQVRLLKDAGENYPAWLVAIAGAQRTILFENYIIANDGAGRRFAAALSERARAGVQVRVIYDWFGGLGLGSHHVLQGLSEAGGEVRVFNAPWIGSPFGWMRRDHRKMMTVDGRVGFVSGLCVSSRWEGDAAQGIAPWRDTGIEITGPAVADLERAFAQVWAAAGTPLPEAALTAAAAIARTGDITTMEANDKLSQLWRILDTEITLKKKSKTYVMTSSMGRSHQLPVGDTSSEAVSRLSQLWEVLNSEISVTMPPEHRVAFANSR